VQSAEHAGPGADERLEYPEDRSLGSPDGHRHDLAEDRLPGVGHDVPPAGEHGHAEQHRAEDRAEQQFTALRGRSLGACRVIRNARA